MCVAAAGAVAAVVLINEAGDVCTAEVHRTVPSPDGRWSVTLFSMECGATVPFNTQASLVPAGAAFSPERHPAFLVLDGTHTLDTVWEGPAAVVMTLPQQVRVFRKDERRGDIWIRYSPGF